MPHLLPPLRRRADRVAGLIEPVIVALGTAGLTGGALAAMALLADRMLAQAAPRRAGS
jgi:hypothetical protein